MTDVEFLNDLQTRSVQNVVVFVTFDELDRLKTMASSLPVLVPADRGRYAMQATEACRLIRLGHQHLARQVAQQLRK
jgi:hypothetical protein